uniref:Secreted protein n=1 Tax=Plectus sambesii TaxID=2011161 RepID=A0A914WY72_9BILA
MLASPFPIYLCCCCCGSLVVAECAASGQLLLIHARNGRGNRPSQRSTERDGVGQLAEPPAAPPSRPPYRYARRSFVHLPFPPACTADFLCARRCVCHRRETLEVCYELRARRRTGLYLPTALSSNLFPSALPRHRSDARAFVLGRAIGTDGAQFTERRASF